MKTKDLSMLLAGLFLVGCSADEEIANISTSESNAISFNVVSNNPQTKALIFDDPTDLQQYPFNVYAFRNGKAMGSPDGIEIAYSNSKWDYADSDQVLYWPHDDAVDFYAVSPVGYDTHYTATINSGSQTIGYGFMFDEYDHDNGEEYHVDLMYASAKDMKKSVSGGVVKLQFKHALSQLQFKAKKKDSNINVEIASITLCNAAHLYGTFTFPTVDNPDGSWSVNPQFIANNTVGMIRTPIVVSGGDNPTDISGNKSMLIIPCSLSKWNLSVPAETSSDVYLKIKCKIWKGSGNDIHYFVPQEGEDYGYTYVPFEATWKPGKRYIYTLVFGGGYTETGEEIDIVPITFEASVTEWNDASGDITDSNPTSL